MKEYSYIILLFALIFSACSSSQRRLEPASNVVDIDVNNSEELDFKMYFDSVRYVALETAEDALIGEITKMYLINDSIIIFDQKSMDIFLFGVDGKFIRNIGEKGDGPDEYLFINDIQFDKERMLIFAHERFRNCIYTYDLHGNLLEQTRKAIIQFNSFIKTKEGFWVYSCFDNENPEHFNLTLLGSDLQCIKKQYFSQTEFVNVTFSPTFVADERGRSFFYYPSSNIIYELSDTDALPFLEINFGDYTMPYDEIRKAKSMEDYDKLILDNNYLGNIERCFLCRNHVLFSFSEAGLGVVKNYNCFYNNDSKRVRIFNNPFMLSSKYPISTSLLYSTDTELVYPIYPSVFSEDSFMELSQALSANIQFDSNLILAICSLKE